MREKRAAAACEFERGAYCDDTYVVGAAHRWFIHLYEVDCCIAPAADAREVDCKGEPLVEQLKLSKAHLTPAAQRSCKRVGRPHEECSVQAVNHDAASVVAGFRRHSTPFLSHEVAERMRLVALFAIPTDERHRVKIRHVSLLGRRPFCSRKRHEKE